MNLKIEKDFCRGVPVIRGTALITKSKKLGIKRKHKKTWVCPFTTSNYSGRTIRAMFEAEAARWYQKTIAKMSLPLPSVPEIQTEIEPWE